MVGACGGWVVRQSCWIRPKVPRHGSVRRSSRCRRQGCSMQSAPGSKVTMHKVAGRGGDRRVDSQSQAAHASGDAARDAPGLRYHKPKTPIGRRGESLILFADYPRWGESLAGPASLLHHTEAARPAGASPCRQFHRRSRTPFRNSACPSALVAACLYSFTSESWISLAKLRSFGSRAISALATAGSSNPNPSSTG